jgi:hypothetical protein
MFAPRKRVWMGQIIAFLMSFADPIKLCDSDVQEKDDKLRNQRELSRILTPRLTPLGSVALQLHLEMTDVVI